MKMVLISLIATSVFLLIVSAVFLSKAMFAFAGIAVLVTLAVIAFELWEDHTKETKR